MAKNTVSASTGIRAYALYSGAAVAGLGIEDLTGEWLAHREEYDAGEVECWVADMTAVWEAARTQSIIDIPDSDVRGQASVEIALPPEMVWDRLTDPEYRRMLINSDRQERTGRAKARLGKGDVYQCYHGDTVVPSVVLEWLPFTRLLTNDLIHVPGFTVYLLVDYTLEPTDSGTKLTMTAARPTGSALARAAFMAIGPTLMKGVEAALHAFKERVEGDAATESP
jgi:uncharacterized protein YndB with AHSA1/START domain